jgi:hypothetical protein
VEAATNRDNDWAAAVLPVVPRRRRGAERWAANGGDGSVALLFIIESMLEWMLIVFYRLLG